MIDTNTALPGAAAFGSDPSTKLDQEPAWKAEFRQTFKDILDQGFRAYTDNIRAEKLEELREKILEAMGLSEEELEKMPASQRQTIERMIAQEMQKRLTAEDALTDKSDEQKSSEGISEQVLATPNGLGAAFVLMETLDPPQQTTEKPEQTGILRTLTK